MVLAQPTSRAETPDHEQTVTPTPARGGWHWAEWGCELAGTAMLLLGGLSGLFFSLSPDSPLPAGTSISLRLLITGVILAATGILVTLSPLGRRSGAHLNPSVSFAFWRRGHMHHADLAGYVIAQLLGAILGTIVARWLWGANATVLDLGATHPGHEISLIGAAAIEAGLTFVLIAFRTPSPGQIKSG